MGKRTKRTIGLKILEVEVILFQVFIMGIQVDGDGGLTLTAPMFNRYRPDNGSRYHWKQQGPSKGKQARISRGKVPSRPASPVLGSEGVHG
ncbi:hypothetical protein NQ317_013630 [Molorchus minor]|uniref:Uncharacterized protein n=1 Tax=Molorchus minor TaxID=1323400 RepID=A0ABQ9IU56_9CUCU|nr:hypothetical protein NQ317_013630 [Molorchus minor]